VDDVVVVARNLDASSTAFAERARTGQAVRVEDVSNDWERRYSAAVACPSCGSSGVHAKSCPVLLEKWRKTLRFGTPVVLVMIALGILGGVDADFVSFVVGGASGLAAVAFLVRRARRTP
jgi:small-conductance mechanosensitive channel